MTESLLATGVTIAHYRIDGKIGAGGMGEVFKAHDLTLERPVALKVLPPVLLNDADRVRRFVQEAKSASALNHPNIVTIYEIGQARPSDAPDGHMVHYIAMEFIDGVTLRSRIYGDASVAELLAILAQSGEGLSKAHGAGIVHRDLKPDNIMITYDGFAKVVDFGLAKLTEKRGVGGDAQSTQDGMIMGTVGYMSPEQVEGKSVDFRSDVFSFGCMLYEAVARRRPFQSDMAVDTLHKIVFSEPPPVQSFVPDTPVQLRSIIDRCLRKSAADRYNSMREVAADLRAVIPQTTSLPATETPTVITNAEPPQRDVVEKPIALPKLRKPAVPLGVRVRKFTATAKRVALLLAVGVAAYVGLTLPDVAALEAQSPVSGAQWVKYDDIGSPLRQATVAAEDRGFLEKRPVTVSQLKNISMSLLRSEEVRWTPSKLTRQTARWIYPEKGWNPLAPVRRYVVAAIMEQKLSRKRIIELYVNAAPYGETTGAQSAAKQYFKRSARSLSEEQATILASAAAHRVSIDDARSRLVEGVAAK